LRQWSERTRRWLQGHRGCPIVRGGTYFALMRSARVLRRRTGWPFRPLCPP